MTNEKSTAKTKDEMRWAMVRPELEAVLEEMWLARVLPLDFGAALERLRLWREMSQEELAREAECPVRTIRRLENGETKRPQLETVVRLCVALSLRWRLGEALLVRCGWVLRAGVYEDEVLRYVLEHCTDMALAEVRAQLAKQDHLRSTAIHRGLSLSYCTTASPVRRLRFSL